MKKRKITDGIATSSMVLAFVQCVTLCTGIIQTMILSRTFSKIQYGTYSQGILIVNFLLPFLLLGLSNAVTYFSGQQNIDFKQYIESLFTLIVILGIVGGISVILLRPWIIQYFNNPCLNEILIYVAIRPLLMNLITAYQTLYIAYNMSMAIAIRNFMLSIAQVIVIALSSLVFGNIKVIFILLITLDILQIVLFAAYFSKKHYFIGFRRISLSLAKTILQYAIPLAISTMVGTLTIFMDKLIIGNMMGTEEFALYSNMSKELPFSFIINSFTIIVTPILVRLKANNRIDNLKEIWKNYIEFGYYTTWILSGSAVVCAAELLRFLYSSKYSEGYWIFIVYLIVSGIRFTYFGIVLTSYGKTKVIMFYSMITLVLNFALNIVLLKSLGMIGPAIASLIVIFSMNAMQMKVSCKLLKCSVFEIFVPRKVIKLLIQIVTVGGVLVYLKSKLMFNYILELFCFYILFVLILMILNRKQIIHNFRTLNQGNIEKM